MGDRKEVAHMFDTIVRGGQVVCESSVVEADLAISEGRIAALLRRGTEAEADQVIDASHKMVIPGVVDAHFHFNTFNDQADSFETASISAAHGGVTTVIAFVSGRPEMSVNEFLEHFRQEGESSSVIDFALHCFLAPPDPKLVPQIPDAVRFGVTSFKAMMAFPKRNLMWNDYHLMSAMEAVARENGLFMVHAEDGWLVDYLEDKLIAEGRYSPMTILASRPGFLEASAISRAVLMAEMAGCRLHVVHLSSRQGLDEIVRAKARGLPVTTETCPPYLLLTEAINEKLGARAKTAPAIKEAADLEALWAGLRTGSIDLIASDHYPHWSRDMDLPADRFAQVPWGMAAVETMLPLIYSEGVSKGRLSIVRMVEVLSRNPARVFGLYPRKGTIQVGSDADLVLLDPTVEWEIRADGQHTRGEYTPFEGWRVKGRPVLSLLRGQILLKDGELRQVSGSGRFLSRSAAAGE
jgi:dihydropyrimidinase